MGEWYPGKKGPHINTHCPQAALARFVSKCEFDPRTGCVVWTGGKTAGRGHYQPYGSFWFAGKRWFAHRWAALHIHGFDISDMQVDHCCPNLVTPNTLCVQHLQAVPPSVNRELQWIRTQKGCDPYPYPEFVPPPVDDVPFYTLPDWMREWVNPGPQVDPFSACSIAVNALAS